MLSFLLVKQCFSLFLAQVLFLFLLFKMMFFSSNFFMFFFSLIEWCFFLFWFEACVPFITPMTRHIYNILGYNTIKWKNNICFHWVFGHEACFDRGWCLAIWCSFMGMGLVVGVVIPRNILLITFPLPLTNKTFINYIKGDYLKDISSKFYG